MADLTDHIALGHSYGDKVERVRDVADLMDEHTPQSDMAVLKAQATLAMKLLLNHMPPSRISTKT